MLLPIILQLLLHHKPLARLHPQLHPKPPLQPLPLPQLPLARLKRLRGAIGERKELTKYMTKAEDISQPKKQKVFPTFGRK